MADQETGATPEDTEKQQAAKKSKRKLPSAKAEAGSQTGETPDVPDTSPEEESGVSEPAAVTKVEVPSEPPASSEKAAEEETARKETQGVTTKHEGPKPRSVTEILRFGRKSTKRRR